MATKYIHFDGSPTGTNVPVNSTGAALIGASSMSGTTGALGTVSFSAAFAASGQCGLSFTNSSAGVTLARLSPTSQTGTTQAVHGIFTAPATTGTAGQPSWSILQLRSTNSGTYSPLQVILAVATGKVSITTKTGGTGGTTSTGAAVKQFGSTSADLVLTAGTKYRLELQTENIAGGVGKYALQIYPTSGATTTPLNNTTLITSTSAVADMGPGVALEAVDIGLCSPAPTAGLTTTIGWDELIIQDNSPVPIGPYTVPSIDLFNPVGTVSTSGGTWVTTGTTLVSALSDNDDATYVTSPDAAGLVDPALLYGAINPINTPAGDLDIIVRCKSVSAATVSVLAKLYAPGDTGRATVLATSNTVTQSTITTSLTNVTLTFTTASISSITSTQWASGVICELTVTAA